MPAHVDEPNTPLSDQPAAKPRWYRATRPLQPRTTSAPPSTAPSPDSHFPTCREPLNRAQAGGSRPAVPAGAEIPHILSAHHQAHAATPDGWRTRSVVKARAKGPALPRPVVVGRIGKCRRVRPRSRPWPHCTMRHERTVGRATTCRSRVPPSGSLHHGTRIRSFPIADTAKYLDATPSSRVAQSGR